MLHELATRLKRWMQPTTLRSTALFRCLTIVWRLEAAPCSAFHGESLDRRSGMWRWGLAVGPDTSGEELNQRQKEGDGTEPDAKVG